MRPLVSVLAVGCGLAFAACGGGSEPDDADDDGSAGEQGGTTGGNAGGKAGTAGSAGAGATGGRTAGGGNAGRGGAESTGGTSSGRGGTGGTADQSGGTSGDSGAAGEDSGPPPLEEPELPAPGASITQAAQGEVIIKTDAEAAAFCASYDGVRGSLRVTGSMIENLGALSCLVEVTGQLELSAFSLKHANLPNLVAVGTLFVATQTALEDISMPKLGFTRNELRIVTTGLSEVELPALESVGEELVIASITSLDAIRLPELTWVANEIDFSNSNLREVDVTNLLYVGGDFRLDETALEHLSLENLRQILGLLVIRGGSYADIDLSALERADGGISLGGGESAGDLTTLEFPELEVVGILAASGFANLTSVSAPLVTQSTTVTFGDTPALTRISFPRLEETSSFTLNEIGESAELDFPELTTVSDVRVELAGRGAFNLPKLTEVHSLEINGALEVNLPALETIDQTAIFGRYSNLLPITDCEISLPALASALRLEFRAGPKGDLDLPSLTDLNDLHLTSTGFESVTMDAVTSLRVVRMAENTALTTLSLKSLESVEDAGFGDSALSELALPALATSDDHLSFSGALLSELDLPALSIVSELVVTGAALTTLNLPELLDAYSLEVDRSGLATLDVPKLTSIFELRLEENPNLTTANLPALETFNVISTNNPLLSTLIAPPEREGGDIYLDGNAALEDLSGITGMERALDITITNNTALTSLTALNGITLVLGDITIYGNTSLSTQAVQDFIDSIENLRGEVILTEP